MASFWRTSDDAVGHAVRNLRVNELNVISMEEGIEAVTVFRKYHRTHVFTMACIWLFCGLQIFASIFVEANPDNLKANISLFEPSIATEWELRGDNEWFLSLPLLIFYGSLLFGSVMFGWLADGWGRKKILGFALLTLILGGILTFLSGWFWMYVVGRSITGIATGGALVISFIFALEFWPIRYRVYVTVLLLSSFTGVGLLTISGIGLFLPVSWRLMLLVITLPCILLGIPWQYLHESAHWFHVNGDSRQATNVLDEVAFLNGNGYYMTEASKELSSIPAMNTKGSILDMFCCFCVCFPPLCSYARSSRLSFEEMKSIFRIWGQYIVILITWFCAFFAGYSVEHQATGTETTFGIYFQTLLDGMLSITSMILALSTLRALPRRYSNAVFLFCLSFILAIRVFFDMSDVAILLMLQMLAKVAMVCSVVGLMIHTAEIFPTTIRCTGFGCAIGSGALGLLLGPSLRSLIVHLWSDSVVQYAFLTFPATAGIAAILVFLLPETKEQPLVETYIPPTETSQPSVTTVTDSISISM